MQERSLETRRGIHFRVREAGSGPPLVYLHGIIGLLDDEPLLERLSQQFRVHAPVWPGFGEEGGEEQLEPAWAKPTISIVVLLLSIPFAGRSGWTAWSSYLSNAVDPIESRKFLGKLRDMGRFAERWLPAGETVLIDDRFGVEIVMLHDITLVANSTTSQGVPNMRARRAEVRRMLSNGTPWDERRELLRKYGIRYLFAFPDTPREWLRNPERVKSQRPGRSYNLIELNVD